MAEEFAEYEVIPLEGVGPVKLGMLRDQVHLAFGKEVDAHGPKEYYNGMMVEYNEDNKVKFIELSRDCGLIATYKGKDVFNVKAAELIDFVSEHTRYDEDDEELGYSYIFPELELSFWRPVIPENDDPDGQYFYTIGVGQKGYFSDTSAT